VSLEGRRPLEFVPSSAVTVSSSTVTVPSSTVSVPSSTVTVPSSTVTVPSTPAPHFVRSLALLLGIDDLKFTPFHVELVHFFSGLAGPFGRGELDEGKSLWLLGMVVPRDVNVFDICDPSKGVLQVMVCNIER